MTDKTLDLSFVGHDAVVDDEASDIDRGDLVVEDTLPEPPAPEPVPEPPKDEPPKDELPKDELPKDELPKDELPKDEPPKDEPVLEPEAKRKILIPKERFDAVNERMRRAEQELKNITAQREQRTQQALEEFNYDEAEQKYADHIINGQLDEAKKIRSEIRERDRQQAERTAIEQSMQAYEQIAAKSAIDAAVAFINTEFAVYDPNSPDYSQPIVDEALELFNGLIQGGRLTPSEALVRASRATAALHQITPAGLLESSPPAAPEPPAKPAPGLEQKLKAAQQQPPQLSQAGVSNGTLSTNMAALTEKEWDSLDDKTLRELRGDFM